MEEYELKNIKGIIIFLVILAAFYGIYKKFVEDKSTNTKEEKAQVVNNYNRFYTVSSCVTKYLNTVSSDNTQNIVTLIDESYKKKNKINEDNVYDYIEKLDVVYDFLPKKMYYNEINKYLTKYYVYGKIKKSLINGNSNNSDYYIIVILDSQNMTFAIEPYDGTMFKD